jgi:hypothetical protein
MKKILLITCFTMLLFFVSIVSFAQLAEKKKVGFKPRWVSENGYWNIEQNIKTPKKSTVYFYSNDHQLLYKEDIVGLRININKRKVKMNLKKVLDQAFLAFKGKQIITENQMLAVNLKRKMHY